MAWALERDRAWLLAHLDEPMPAEGLSTLDGWVGRRAAGEPIAYIRGFKEWYGLRLATDRRALIPRPETEQLVDAAVADIAERLVRDDRPIVAWDVGTGSGAVAVALARRFRAALALGRLRPGRERRLGRCAGAGQREPRRARRGGAGDRDAGRPPGARRLRATPGRGGCQPPVRAQRGGRHPVRKPGLGAGDALDGGRTASTSSARCWRAPRAARGGRQRVAGDRQGPGGADSGAGRRSPGPVVGGHRA